ncbi:unnamed protein product [Chrysoparadoxa australica]
MPELPDIQVAVMVADMNDVRKYVDGGGDLEVLDEEGATPLFQAAFWTHDEVAKTLLEGGANVNHQRDDGYTPLHVAARNNQPRLVQILIDGGADLSIKETAGDTALHWAYRSNAEEVIKILLDAGSSADELNNDGKKPKEVKGSGVEGAVLEPEDDGDEEHDEDAAEEGDGEMEPEDDSASPNDDQDTVISTKCEEVAEGQSRQSRDFSTHASNWVTAIASPKMVREGSGWHKVVLYLRVASSAAEEAVAKDLQAREEGGAFSYVGGVGSEQAVNQGRAITVKPNLPAKCLASPTSVTIEGTKDFYAMEFELSFPEHRSGAKINATIDCYIGIALAAQARLQLELVGSDSDVPEKLVLGEEAKAYSSTFLCYAQKSESLMASAVAQLHDSEIIVVTHKAGDSAGSTRDRITKADVFQLCWTEDAEDDELVQEQLELASELAKAGKCCMRGIHWESCQKEKNISTPSGLQLSIVQHNSFILDLPKSVGLLQAAPSFTWANASAAVTASRKQFSIIRKIVSDASVVECPPLVWLTPDAANPKRTAGPAAWLKGPVRLSFLCPVSLYCAASGSDGRGYSVRLPSGWPERFGAAIRISLSVLSAAARQGTILGLPLPPGTQPTAGKRLPTERERQAEAIEQLIDEVDNQIGRDACEALTPVFDGEASDEAKPLAKLAYCNLLEFVASFDTDLSQLGVVKVTSGEATEWVHPFAVAEFESNGATLLVEPAGQEEEGPAEEQEASSTAQTSEGDEREAAAVKIECLARKHAARKSVDARRKELSNDDEGETNDDEKETEEDEGEVKAKGDEGETNGGEKATKDDKGEVKAKDDEEETNDDEEEVKAEGEEKETEEHEGEKANDDEGEVKAKGDDAAVKDEEKTVKKKVKKSVNFPEEPEQSEDDGRQKKKYDKK